MMIMLMEIRVKEEVVVYEFGAADRAIRW